MGIFAGRNRLTEDEDYDLDSSRIEKISGEELSKLLDEDTDEIQIIPDETE